MASDSAIVWFRNDLRLEDNAALRAACRRGGPVIPVFVWSPDEEGAWRPGAASRVWLHDSLKALDIALRKAGSRLVVRKGSSGGVLAELARETKAGAVYLNRRYEPALVHRDEKVRVKLEGMGLGVESFNSALLFEPWDVVNRQGKPFQVFTPFWNACLKTEALAEPIPGPKRIRAPREWPASLALEELRLEPGVDWAGGIRETWRPGEKGAHVQLERFIEEAAAEYAEGRERPDCAGTSRLSPHLHFGEIGPRQIWHAVQNHCAGDARTGLSKGVEAYVRQLGWREFAHHLLHHFPRTTDAPLRQAFARFPWRDDAESLRAWQRGQTGIPIVDAGMRELWATGWMHNRVRMVVASFLTKDLLIPWQQGARWFWDTLVDADLANNTLGWQWVAGCGADAAPYFRIFNPVTQGERYDPDGEYVRRWVPELARLPARWIHKPWDAPASVGSDAGVALGETYPEPIVEHAEARARALDAYGAMRRG